MQTATSEITISHLRALNADRPRRRARLGFIPPHLGPARVEIQEEAEVDTRLKVELCHNQVVMISAAAVAEAQQAFEKITTHPSIKKIQAVTAKHFSLTAADICNARRTGNLILPRHVAFYLCHEHTPRSLPEIGRCFGGKDHTTVLYAHRKIAAFILKYADIAQDVAEIEQKLGVSK